MEVRTAVTRNGGTLADPGSVSRLFTRKGVIVVPKEQEKNGEVTEVTEDDVLEATLDAGAEDVNDHDESFQVISEATDVVDVRQALQTAAIDYDSADVEFVPSMEIPVDKDAAVKVLKLADALEDLDDVQNVFTNVDIPDDVLAQLDDED
jgi:transcriptional/translational regulatory protein YebC/TACO1